MTCIITLPEKDQIHSIKILDEEEKQLLISRKYKSQRAEVLRVDKIHRDRSEGFDHTVFRGRIEENVFVIESKERRVYGSDDYYNSIQSQIPHALEYLDEYNRRLYRDTIGSLEDGIITSSIGDTVISERCKISVEDDVLSISIDPYAPILHALQYSSRLTVIVPTNRLGIYTVELIGRVRKEEGKFLFTATQMQYGKKTELETYRIQKERVLHSSLDWIREKIVVNAARIRAPLLLESIIPYSIGSLALGLSKPKLFMLALLALICIQIAGNLLNDYFDYLTAKDLHYYEPINSEFRIHGSSRFIQHGISLPYDTLVQGLLFLTIGGSIGIYVNSVVNGNFVLWIGIVGALLAILYSFPPISLAKRGLGELIILITWVYLPFIGGVYIQNSSILLPLYATLLTSVLALMTLLLIIQVETIEFEADRRSKKRTILQLLGKNRYKALSQTILVLIAVLYLGMIPIFNLLEITVLFLPVIYVIRRILAGDYSQEKLFVSMVLIGIVGLLIVGEIF